MRKILLSMVAAVGLLAVMPTLKAEIPDAIDTRAEAAARRAGQSRSVQPERRPDIVQPERRPVIVQRSRDDDDRRPRYIPAPPQPRYYEERSYGYDRDSGRGYGDYGRGYGVSCVAVRNTFCTLRRPRPIGSDCNCPHGGGVREGTVRRR
jgi:hypothetical protein